ncbi:A/G-specific adenine glycosylase [Candidatus Entotheonella serta]|nr:A/G-specific adenine glycosylase [Candidatus Entotheonella serta]
MAEWTQRLLDWFAQYQRWMPWRDEPQPYWTWLSEVMLQQTQVETVIPYFKRFVEAFPTVEALAKADQQDVLKLWEGLGYYSRARNLHKAAKVVVEQYGGALPQDADALQKIPGFGPYTSAAVSSIAFGRPVPVVDGNVLRVFCRFWGIEDDIRQPHVKTELQARLEPFIKDAPPSSAFNQAIMELGALVCRPKFPHCASCPLGPDCVALRDHRTADLPVKSKRKPVPHYPVAVGVIWKAGKVLIGRRRQDQMLGGLWEFPGGKQLSEEPLTETLRRKIETETGLQVRIDSPYCQVSHGFTHFKITVTAFRCEWQSGTEQPMATDELRWVTLDELDRFPLPKAAIKVAEAVRNYERMQGNA